MTIGVHFRVTDQSTCLKLGNGQAYPADKRIMVRTEDWDTMTFKKRKQIKEVELPEN